MTQQRVRVAVRFIIQYLFGARGPPQAGHRRGSSHDGSPDHQRNGATSMADNQPNPTRMPVASLTVPQVTELVERLGDRADKIENLATQDLADDLRLAAKVIRALIRNINSADILSLDR